MFLSLRALVDIFNTGWCPTKLTAANLTLSKATMDPKFVKLQIKPITDEGVEDCVRSLATIFEADLLLGLTLPYEVRHLLSVMKNFALDLLPLALYHPCLVPMENRCDYFARMYGYLRYVLRPKHRVAYEFVLANVNFPKDWDQKLKTNKYLKMFFDSAPASCQYYPLGRSTPAVGRIPLTEAQKAAAEKLAKKEAAEEVLRYQRNTPAHILQLAAHTNSPDGMIFNRTGIARMLYSVLDGVVVALAECLARVSHFFCLDLESLFPGRVVAKKP